MASIDMCEHDWPGSGCKECFPERKAKAKAKTPDSLDQYGRPHTDGSRSGGQPLIEPGVADHWQGGATVDRTIRELQSSLPWTGHYHRDFRATPMTHKDFGHALLHVHKAGGKLAAIIDDAEHKGVDFADLAVRETIGNYVADLVICALRMANTCPDGVLDLQAAIEHRLAAKNNQKGAA